jgi:DNA-binding response OmpR family regulator
MEFDLLALLISNKNVALSRDYILSKVWGINYEGGTRTVDVHIAQLRRKTDLQILSIPKYGYRLEG